MRKEQVPSSNGKFVVHFRLRPEEVMTLKALAKAEERSVAFMVARAVRQWLSSHPLKEQR